MRRLVLLAIAIMMASVWPVAVSNATVRPSPLFRPYIQDVNVCHAVCGKKECGDNGGYIFRINGLVSTYGHGGPYRVWGTILAGNRRASAPLDDNVLGPKSSNKFFGSYVASDMPDRLIITVGVRHNVLVDGKGSLTDIVLFFLSDRIELGTFSACGEKT